MVLSSDGLWEIQTSETSCYPLSSRAWDCLGVGHHPGLTPSPLLQQIMRPISYFESVRPTRPFAICSRRSFGCGQTAFSLRSLPALSESWPLRLVY
jgi:hypothetical protein